MAGLGAWVLVVGLFAPVPDESPQVLEHAGPPSCPDREALLEEIDGLLEWPMPAVTDAYRFVVELHQRDEGGFQGQVEVHLESGVTARDFEHLDCTQLTRAIAFVIALTVSEQRERMAEKGPPEPPAQPPAEPVEAPTSPPEDDPTEAPPRRPLSGLLQVAGGMGYQPLPRVAAEFDLRGGVELGEASVTLGLGYSLPQTLSLEFPDDLQAQARFQRWVLALRGGYGWHGERLGVVLEAGAEAGQVRASATGVEGGGPQQALWVAALAAATFGVRLHPNLRLDLRAEVPIALTRPQFTIDDTQVIHQSAPIGVRAGLGLTFHLPVKKSRRPSMERSGGGHT